ncbi:DMT family transporter [Fictibacillus sp. KIGAM418]|uniref:DMT family transporter n=1 Tax=Fictibacillus marinisediminis TaxID=2878389 RepID=A0A9X2BEB6_9BACL|nr:DMT family transporter [Fictibacillus marinisediminis]MCK6258491.1 DMT family transporter [Fictibacillus marinisediminis]
MKNLSVYLMLLGFAVFTGATFNLGKYAVGYFSPASAAAWRFGIAAIVLLLILIVKEGVKKTTLSRNLAAYAALGIIGVFGFNTLFFTGLKYTSPISGALIMGTNPILTSVLALFLLKEKLTKQRMAGIGFAFIGVVLVITQGSWETLMSQSFSKGDLIILGGNLCWASYGVLGRKWVKDSSSLETTAYPMLIGAAALIAVSLFSRPPAYTPHIPLGGWGAILFMAICTTVLGYLWWNLGIRKIGAGKTSLFFNLVPVVTMIISAMTGTSITYPQLLGVGCVILGVLTASGVLSLFNQKTESHVYPEAVKTK